MCYSSNIYPYLHKKKHTGLVDTWMSFSSGLSVQQNDESFSL